MSNKMEDIKAIDIQPESETVELVYDYYHGVFE